MPGGAGRGDKLLWHKTGCGSFTGLPTLPSPTHAQEHLAALVNLASPRLPVPVTNSLGHLLLNQKIWKKDLNAFKMKSSIHNGGGQ